MTKLANKLALFAFMAIIVFTGCKKMTLLTDDDQGEAPAGSYIRNMTIWQYLSDDNFHANDSSGIGAYGRAIEHAGLKDLLNSNTSKFTVIIPTKAAMNAMVASMGFSEVTQIPPIVLKNMLSSTIAETPVRSFDLSIGEIRSMVTINNDSLYLTRNANNTDEYVLVVNSSPLLAVTGPTVRAQNLEFTNGVAHVVPTFTYYQPKTQTKDPIDPNNVTVQTDTVEITKDAYMNAGTSAMVKYGHLTYLEAKTASINFTKRAITQFPVRQPGFSGRIGSVELSLYFSAVDADGGSIDFFEDENVDWDEYNITWNNAPAQGNVSMYSIPLNSAGLNKRYNGTVSSAYLNALQSGKTFINIGLNSYQRNRLRFQSREGNREQRPYLLLKSEAVTVLSNPTNSGFTVSRASGIKSLNSSILNMEGTAPKNIFYTVKQTPSAGYVVVGGMPLAVGSMFSQEQVNMGLVKYLVAGSGAADSFVLEASDFQNGFYPNLLTVNVTIQ